MTIRYKCEECGAALNIKDELAGTRGSCPRCQVEFTVPQPDGAPAPEKQPAAAAVPKADDARPGDPLSDDDIERILAAGGPPSGIPSYSVAIAGDDEEAEEPEEEPRPRKKSRVAAEEEEPEEDEDDDEVELRRKKKGAAAKTAKKKLSDSSESAAIARDLMARGEKATREDRGDKRAGRPFGGRDRPDQEDEFTTKEKLVALAKQYGHYVGGALVLILIVLWATHTSVSTPPLAQVTGTVKLDGAPLEGAIVSFQPTAEGPNAAIKLSTSFGFTDKEGKYTLIYMNSPETGEILGAVIGKHIVRINKTDEKKGEAVPARYNHNSDLTREVKKGGPPLDFDLVSEKSTEQPVEGAVQQQ